MGDELIVLGEDLLPALRERVVGNVYFGEGEFYKITDILRSGDEGGLKRVSSSGGQVIAHISVLYTKNPGPRGGWLDECVVDLSYCDGDRKASPAEKSFFEAAEERAKQGKLETAADMRVLKAEMNKVAGG